MPEKSQLNKFSLSNKTPKERGITFSIRGEVSEQDSSSSRVGVDLTGKQVLLGPWRATAICGNDITSSCLYVAAMASAYAGMYAPFALLAVAGLLYLYRKIYAEVGDALPLNGGAYNCLLNTTTKARASLAACMTILSYIATAVISAKTSVEYTLSVAELDPQFSIPATIGLLAVFAALTIIGIGESASAALVIFLFHLVSLSVLIVFGAIYAVYHPEIFTANWQNPLPEVDSVGVAIFFGFCISLLGVSGFESSANFIEEQKPGVFPITLRNMWIAVTVLNPAIALVALSVLPLDGVIAAKKSMLLAVADVSAGTWLKWVIAIDAAVVLSGAVLAAFIGVTGLVQRMTLDRCLPQFLLKTGRRGTNHRIILMFFLCCVSILVATAGDLDTLGGVYTLSFLGVMCLFAVGNILLKIRRAKLPRKFRASWPSVFVALLMTVAGIYGNMILKSEYIYYFSVYFFPTVGLVLLTLHRHSILSFLLVVADETMRGIETSHQKLRRRIKVRMDKMNDEGIIFFTKGDDVASLNKALLYVRDNETSRKLTVVHILNGMEEPPPRLVTDLKLLDEIYPDIKLELVIRKGKFGPDIIKALSSDFGIPPNYMFVGTPGDHFPHQLSSLGGVRVII
jgi:amino acid transporter